MRGDVSSVALAGDWHRSVAPACKCLGRFSGEVDLAVQLVDLG